MATVETYLSEAMLRIAAMQREALAVYNADAKDYFYHWQESFPYFVNRITDEDTVFDSEDYKIRNYTITMRLVVGHLTEGYDGTPERNLYAFIPLVENKFDNNRVLTSVAYPTPMDWLNPEDITLERSRGTTFFEMTGVGGGQSAARQVGSEWTLTLPFHIDLEQEY